MSNHQGCPHRRETIAAFVMALLDPREAQELRRHLDSCGPCRQLHEELRQQEQEVLWAFERIGKPARAIAEAATRVDEPLGTKLPRRAGRRGLGPLRRFQAMQPVARVAMAAAILVGIVGVYTLSRRAGHRPGPSFAILAQPAYADVLQQIEKARSMAYTKTFQEENDVPSVMQQMVLEGGRMRSVWAEGTIIVSDFASGEVLTLNAKRKTARLSHHIQDDRARLLHLPDWIKTLHERKGEFVRQEILDGRPVNVYKVDEPYEKITIWTDPVSSLPVRLEKILLPCTDKDIRVPQMTFSTSDFAENASERAKAEAGPGMSTSNVIWGAGILEKKTTVTLGDFTWNAEYHESLFSLTPPADYTVHEKTEYGDAVSDPQSLAEALGFWAETSDGRFPENINMLADSQPNLVRKYRAVGPPAEAFKPAIRMMNTVLAGMYFAQERKLEDNWHYDGRNVTLGQADKPLAWWLDKESQTWRVIYGDLRIREAAAEPGGGG